MYDSLPLSSIQFQMYLKVTLLALLFSGFSGLATFVLSFNLLIVFFGKRIFAAFLDFFSTKYNEVSDSMKVELFKDLNDTQPGEKVKEASIISCFLVDQFFEPCY